MHWVVSDKHARTPPCLHCAAFCVPLPHVQDTCFVPEVYIAFTLQIAVAKVFVMPCIVLLLFHTGWFYLVFRFGWRSLRCSAGMNNPSISGDIQNMAQSSKVFMPPTIVPQMPSSSLKSMPRLATKVSTTKLTIRILIMIK